MDRSNQDYTNTDDTYGTNQGMANQDMNAGNYDSTGQGMQQSMDNQSMGMGQQQDTYDSNGQQDTYGGGQQQDAYSGGQQDTYGGSGMQQQQMGGDEQSAVQQGQTDPMQNPQNPNDLGQGSGFSSTVQGSMLKDQYTGMVHCNTQI